MRIMFLLVAACNYTLLLLLLLCCSYRAPNDLLTAAQQIPSCFLCLVLQARPEAAAHTPWTRDRASGGEIRYICMVAVIFGVKQY